jgi:HSP20 family molecular chaperone IbpA
MNDDKKHPLKKKPEREPVDFNKEPDFDLFEKVFGNLFNSPNDSLGFDFKNVNPEDLKKNVKTFNFKFGTGMDKPEVSLNGEPIEFNEDFLKDIFSKGLPEGFNLGFLPQTPEIDAGDITFAESSVPSENESEHEGETQSRRTKRINDYSIKSVPYEDPYAEIEENSNSANIIIELPEIETSQIILNYFHKELTITAENDLRKFRAEFKLKFEPNRDHTIIENNNGIYIIKLKE